MKMTTQNNQDFEIPLLPSKMVATLCTGNKRPEPCLSEAYQYALRIRPT